MDDPKKEALPRKKLVLTVNNRAALSGQRSNFVPQTKTVVVHHRAAVVLDSPERAARDKLSNGRSGLGSLGSIGRQHFKHQVQIAAGENASTTLSAPKLSQHSKPAATTSAFLTSAPTITGAPITQSTPVKQSTLSKLVSSLSQGGRSQAASYNHAASIPVGPTSLSAKFKARVERSLEEKARLNTTRVPAVAAPSVGSYSGPVDPPASELTTQDVRDSEPSHVPTVSSGGLSSLFQGMGKTLAVKSGPTAAPTKTAKFAGSFVSNSSSHLVNDADLQVYGEYNCEAAGVVGGYLDSVIQTIAAPAVQKTVASSHAHHDTNDNSHKDSGISATKVNAHDASTTDVAEPATAGGKSKKKSTGGADAGDDEVDSFNNFVRKNLKSGGTSKHLNRATTRVSMSKQRWLTRAGENGQSNSGKGKYNSKFGKGKYGSNKNGGASGYKNGGSIDAGGGGDGAGGGGYNKPRGLQQWGLDALEMSLDLIEQHQATVPVEMDTTTAHFEAPSGVDNAQKSDQDQDEDGSIELDDSDGSEAEVELEVDTGSSSPYPQTVCMTSPSKLMRKPVVPVAPVSGGQCSLQRHRDSVKQDNSTVKSAPTRAASTSSIKDVGPVQPSAPAAARTISLDALDKGFTKSSTKRLSAQDKLSAKVNARTKLNDRINAMTACAPKCPGHSMPSKLLVVKKSGANKGKYFYSCTFPAEQRCNFFMWADDNPELLGKVAELNNPSGMSSSNTNAAAATVVDPEQARLQYTLHVYATKLRAMSRDELKQEVLNFNKRSALSATTSNRDSRVAKIGITGTKDDIVARLFTEAVRQLGGKVSHTGGGGDSESEPERKTKPVRVKKQTKATNIAESNRVPKPPRVPRSKAAPSDSEDQSDDGQSTGEQAVYKESKEQQDAPEWESRSSSRRSALTPAQQAPRTSSAANAQKLRNAEVVLSGSESEQSDEMEIEGAGDSGGAGSGNDVADESSIDFGSSDNDSAGLSDSDSIDVDAAAEVLLPDSAGNDVNGSIDSSSEDGSDVDGNSSDSSNEVGVSDAEEGAEEEEEDSATEESAEEDVVAVKRRRGAAGAGASTADSKAFRSSKSTGTRKNDTSTSAVDRHARGGRGAVAMQSEDEQDFMDVEQVDPGVEDDASFAVDHLELLLRKNFGFSVFRPGQRWAISRCLSGQNSLLVMPTGAGKSLCYMLPSLALPGLTVVVSPLIALMQDQLRKLPLALPGACLSGSLTAQQMMQISDAVLKGHIKVLYVSPERLCTPSFRRLITLLKQQRAFRPAYGGSGSSGEEQPVVSLLCVDEAHCLSQWSYNFRPAFLRIRREVQFIQPAAVLALTATATPRIQYDVMCHLGIPTEAGLMALPVRRDNLQVTVHMIVDEEHRRKLIVDLVKNPRIVDVSTVSTQTEHEYTDFPHTSVGETVCGGMKRPRSLTSAAAALDKRRESFLTIVYVWRRFEADSLGEYLKASGVQGVAIYHAGIDAGTRARTQLMFDRGKVRCIVATVAFGMGVDKADVRQVIHCTMPKSIESYMQEMGRAGRDGLPAACHLLLQQEDAVLQHSLSHSMQLSRIQIASLLLKVFQLRVAGPAEPKGDVRQFLTHALLEPEVSLLLDPLEPTIDINSTVVETIMSVLELPPFNLLIVNGTHFDVIKGRFRMNTAAIEKVDILVAALLATNTSKANQSDTHDVDTSSKIHDSASGGGRNGMNDTYGLGLDCSASAAHQGLIDENDLRDGSSGTGAAGSSGWQRDRKLGGTYGGKIQDFECSRLKVAQRTGLSVDEVSTGLYKLQKSGVLEYKLQDSALYLKICNGLSPTASAHTFESYCATHKSSMPQVGASKTVPGSSANQLYFAWLWQLSHAVFDALLKIASGGSHRIVDMWRTGRTIAHYTDSAQDKTGAKASAPGKPFSGVKSSAACAPVRSVSESVALHGAAQSLLSYVMSDADGEAGADTHDSDNLDALSSEMRDMYLATPVPFQTLLQGGEGDGQENRSVCKLQDRLRNDVQLLQRDPNLLTAVNVMLKQCVPLLSHQASVDSVRRANLSGAAVASENSRGATALVSVQAAKSELLALCMCRILHALPTRLLPASAWRDRSDAWGRYKDTSFEQMLTFIAQELEARR